MKLLFQKTSCSENDTEQFAAEMVEKIPVGSVVELTGDLGAGKTFLVKSFCRFLNINEVSSPSFAIVNEYYGKHNIYHFDFYRIKKVSELFDIGIYDYLNDANALKFIEWGEMYEEVLPNDRFVVTFEQLENNKRIISLYINE